MNAEVFDSFFRLADLDKDGRISGKEAVGFFKGSGLPQITLAKVDYPQTLLILLLALSLISTICALRLRIFVCSGNNYDLDCSYLDSEKEIDGISSVICCRSGNSPIRDGPDICLEWNSAMH